MTAKLMLMLVSALFTALDSRPIRSSRDGYDATACHGSLVLCILYLHVPEVEYVRSDLRARSGDAITRERDQ